MVAMQNQSLTAKKQQKKKKDLDNSIIKVTNKKENPLLSKYVIDKNNIPF